MERESDHTIKIYTEYETIETTALHPFYVDGRWIEASELKTGDKLLTKDSEEIEIKETEYSYEPQKVYNFEVDDWHTYFVGLLMLLVHNAKRCVSSTLKKIKKVSSRLKYMGRTPGKNSDTGQKVFARMMEDKKARIRKGQKQFFDKYSKKWRPIEQADMGHIEDAVKYWNREGYKHGAKSKKVRDWMKDSKNYELEYYKVNRSRGGKLKDRYRTPENK